VACSNTRAVHSPVWFTQPGFFYARPGCNRDMDETSYKPKRSDVVLTLVFLLVCIAIAAVFW